MTTYTMNGHRHSTMQIQSGIIKGIVENQVAQFMRARWQLGTRPEQFSCLESADPQIQLQEALTQIEKLLQENTQLLQNVLLLSQALNDAHSLRHTDESTDRPDGYRLRLEHEHHGWNKQAHMQVRSNTLERQKEAGIFDGKGTREPLKVHSEAPDQPNPIRHGVR